VLRLLSLAWLIALAAAAPASTHQEAAHRDTR
jgi:hypothetical protein